MEKSEKARDSDYRQHIFLLGYTCYVMIALGNIRIRKQ
jgi:hypothetical protein